MEIPEDIASWEGNLGRVFWNYGCIILWVVLLLWGCATRRDVVTLDRESNRLESQIASQQKEREILQRDLEKLQKDFKAFQKESMSLQKETYDLKSDVTTESKKVQADLLLRLETLQTEVRTLSTGIEEYKDLLKKTPKEMDRLRENIVLRTKALEDREKIFEEKDKGLEQRIRGVEDRMKGVEDRMKGSEERMKGSEEYLRGFEGKISQLALKQSELEGAILSKEASVDMKGFSTRVGDLYKEAFETYQKGDFEGARRRFEAFLKQYPNTELSDNAQFWIGETYYQKKDYEKAVLEYEKAIAKYPEGDKIPAALLKQALAFLELGDKTNGRNLLKRVIERYPNSEQADMAKKKLETIK